VRFGLLSSASQATRRLSIDDGLVFRAKDPLPVALVVHGSYPF
jgi:hypothetical protein